MEQVARSLGVHPHKFSLESLAAFQQYDWPGNVREFKNLIERVMILHSKSIEQPESIEEASDDSASCTPSLGLDTLPPEISGLTFPTPLTSSSTNIFELPLKKARELFEKQYLLAQLTQAEGNVSKMAASIGMERAALHRKLRHLKISKSI